jgi:steroid delta-isomerase-like uncharacterized protein
MQKDNVSILHEFMKRVWNQQEYDAVPTFVGEQYTIRLDTGDPWEGKTLTNDEYVKRLHYSFDSFPDMHFAIQQTIADGDNVVITWILTGTNLGTIGAIPATGKKINTNGMTIYHFKNGKVIGHTQVFDRMTVMRQLGFING